MKALLLNTILIALSAMTLSLLVHFLTALSRWKSDSKWCEMRMNVASDVNGIVFMATYYILLFGAILSLIGMK